MLLTPARNLISVLLDFCKNNSADCSDFAELKDIICDIKIKHAFIMVRGDQNQTFFHMGMIKPNRTNIILPLKKYCQTYSVVLVSKNIKTFCLNNGQDKRHPPSFSTYPLPQIPVTR